MRGSRAIAAVVGALVALALLWRLLAGGDPEAARRPADPPPASKAEVARPHGAELVEAPAAPEVAQLDATAPEPEPAPAVAVADPGAFSADLRVVDERCGEGVPDVLVTLTAGDRSLELVTDASGRATTTEPLPAGPVGARVSDAGVEIGAFSKDWSGEGRLSWTLPVPIGPTYDVRLATPVALGDPGAWTARLVERVLPLDVAGELLVVADGLAIAPREVERTWSWQQPREPGSAWIRWPRIEHEREGGRRIYLVVRPALWAEESVEVSSTLGRHAPPGILLRQQVTSFGSSLTDDDGRPVAGAVVLLLPENSKRPAPPIWERTVSDGAGAFAFERVATGRRTLVPLASGFRGTSRTLHLKPGGLVAGLRLRRGTTGTAFELHGPSVGEDPEERLYVVAAHHHADPYAWARLLQDDGALGTRMSEVELPGGILVMRSIVRNGSPRFRPFAWRDNVPHRDYAVDVIPRDELRPIRFVVTDARDGSLLPAAQVLTGPDGAVLHMGDDLAPGELLWMPDDAPFTWSVTAREHAPARGDRDDVRIEDGLGVVRVALRTGWGVSLYFRAGDPDGAERDPAAARHNGLDGLLGAPPLPGVEVLADGEPVGRSDERGVLHVASGGVPLKLGLRCAGWRLAGLDRVGGAGDDRFVIWLAREPL